MNPLVVLGLKALGVLAAIGLLLWSIHAIDQSRQQIGYDRRVAEDNGDLVKAQAEALATERELNRKLEEARNEATKRDQVITRHAAAISPSLLPCRAVRS
jgi:predicted Holliday junction resolvase-like endonuclease